MWASRAPSRSDPAGRSSASPYASRSPAHESRGSSFCSDVPLLRAISVKNTPVLYTRKAVAVTPTSAPRQVNGPPSSDAGSSLSEGNPGSPFALSAITLHRFETGLVNPLVGARLTQPPSWG